MLIVATVLPLTVLAQRDTVSTAGVQFSSGDSQGTKTLNSTRSEKGKAGSQSLQNAGKPVVVKQLVNDEKRGLWEIFIAGLLGGLAALFMPCIFPMLPFTVSYFTKKSHTKSKSIGYAMLYGISIIVVYVVLGLIITIAFGADALNSMATNAIFNLFFFVLLVVFAASFLGAFEITLPSNWVNKMDQQSDKGGLAGIFFMAATLSLVSFSCTGPIIGTLLVQAAVSGALLGPAIGMFGFSLALAVPFALFATFPALLQSLPKSGGWLNSVKVVLGFLELALALKFLSNVDLAYHWHWFDRELFLSLWIIIFGLLGIYLLGKLKLSHDSEIPKISVLRLFTAIIVLSFTTYMIPGLWGAPLKSISAFLPPQATQDFDLYTPIISGNMNSLFKSGVDTSKHKYAGLFDKPAGQNPYFDYMEGLAVAKKLHKPVMIDFTGHACVNCRKMEASVWTDKNVLPVIRDQYVLIQLYVDDKTTLAEREQYTSKFSGELINTIGAMNSDIQATRYNSNSQPFYVLLNPADEQPLVTPEGADYDPSSYLNFLETGLKKFNN